VAVAVFAITLKLTPFFAILGASLVWFWLSSAVVEKKRNSQA
jgi:hypothetical protein